MHVPALWCVAAVIAAAAAAAAPPESCNPKLPTQLCPGGIECPQCGGASCLCPQPWKQCPPHCPAGHPLPPPVPRPYESLGSIDVGTYESTVFWWANTTYVLENIACTYADHAGRWDPAFANHSYARVRNLHTGAVVTNISSSIAFGFLNVFPDYDRNRLWLFGTPSDRCFGNCGSCTGSGCPGRPACTSIQAWWTSLPEPTRFGAFQKAVVSSPHPVIVLIPLAHLHLHVHRTPVGVHLTLQTRKRNRVDGRS